MNEYCTNCEWRDRSPLVVFPSGCVCRLQELQQAVLVAHTHILLPAGPELGHEASFPYLPSGGAASGQGWGSQGCPSAVVLISAAISAPGPLSESLGSAGGTLWFQARLAWGNVQEDSPHPVLCLQHDSFLDFMEIAWTLAGQAHAFECEVVSSLEQSSLKGFDRSNV